MYNAAIDAVILSLLSQIVNTLRLQNYPFAVKELEEIVIFAPVIWRRAVLIQILLVFFYLLYYNLVIGFAPFFANPS